MTESPPHPQLTLPSIVDGPRSKRIRGALEDSAVATHIHLRCSTCGWRRILRLPRTPVRSDPIEPLLPRVPVRHWVFSPGESAQSLLATQPRLRTRVARACVAAVFAWLRRAAGRMGLAAPLHCGAVSTIHRVGATLETNVHVHALVLDGVYTHDPDGTPVFHPTPTPRRRDLQRMLAELRHRIDSLLASAPRSRPGSRRTHVVHRMTAGPRVHPVTPDPRALIQRSGELDVRAGPPIAGDDPLVRARLCRYVARAPFDPLALSPGSDGRLRYRLHRPFRDGTTHVEFSAHVLAERLEAIATERRRPPIAFHGVVAPAAIGRRTRARQLSLLDEPRSSSRSASPVGALQCVRCQGPLDIVGVEWGARAA